MWLCCCWTSQKMEFISLTPVFLCGLSLLLADIPVLLSSSDGLVCSECAVIQSGSSFCRWEQGRCLSQSKDCCEPGSADNCCECPHLFVSSTSHCYSRNRLFFPTKDLPLPVVLQLCTVQIAQCLKKQEQSLEIFPQDEFI